MSRKQYPPEELREFYITSPMREGVLCWYPFNNDSSVLDISGGALTELLHRQCIDVFSAEDANCSGTFDYIVVLDPDDFSTDALRSLKAKLKSKGKLLLAYENPYALRYWSGKRSRPPKLPYEPLIGCDGRISAAELRIRLRLAGLEGQKWYYPLTDHWFTREVYSENYLPDEHLNQRFIPYITDDAALMFDERWLYREMIRGGAFEFMCGAYLVEARVCAQEEPCTVDYAAVTIYREPAKRFATTVCADGKVYKTPLHPDGEKSVENIIKNHDELDRLGVNILPIKLEGKSIVSQRLNLPTLWDYWAKKLSDGTFDEDEMISQFDRIREAIMMAGKTGKCYWELVPANCFFDAENDELIFFDQEYFWDNVTLDVAVTRALWSMKYSHAFYLDSRTEKWIELLKERYGLVKHWDELSELADAKATAGVFGNGAQRLEMTSDRASNHITKRYEKLNRNRQDVNRYYRFYPAAYNLKRMGYCRPAIYGFGARGKVLHRVLDDNDIEAVAVLDQSIPLRTPMEAFLDKNAADILIVSILDSDGIAADLRTRLRIPVFTLEEILDEQSK